MEPHHKVCRVFLFMSVLICGVVATLSLLIISTNLTTCSPPSPNRVSAITYLLISLGVLEAVNLLKNAVMCCQQYNQCWPTKGLLIWLLASSCLSTCGLSTLLFYILPNTDLLRGSALLMSFVLLPMALKTFLLHDFKTDKAYYKPLLVVCLALQMLAVGFTTVHDYAKPTTTSGELSHQPITWAFPTTYSLTIIITILLVPFTWISLYIDGDITLLTKKLNLAAFQYQLQRCQYKFGLVLWIWKVFWMSICLYFFLPSYLASTQTDTVTCSPALLPKGLAAQQINMTRDTLKELLDRDELQNSKASPSKLQTRPQWRYFCEKERDPSWIPPQQIESVNMIKTEDIMDMLEKLRAYPNVESPKYQKLKNSIDAIILHGRYSKRSVEAYSKLISYIEGTSVDAFDESNEITDGAYRVLAIAFVCSSVVTLLSVKAACQWQLTRSGYIIPASMIVPVCLLLINVTCTYPSEITPLLKCPESLTPSALILLIICLIWLISQSLFLLHTYHTGGTSLDFAIDLSMPLTSSALVLAFFSAKKPGRSSQVFKSYKFNYIKTEKVPQESCPSTRTESDSN
ncbi:uncharacterized protein [Watersipora subatra]